jgi:hypothetical protein
MNKKQGCFHKFKVQAFCMFLSLKDPFGSSVGHEFANKPYHIYIYIYIYIYHVYISVISMSPRRCVFRVWSSALWRPVALYMGANFSEQRAISIFSFHDFSSEYRHALEDHDLYIRILFNSLTPSVRAQKHPLVSHFALRHIQLLHHAWATGEASKRKQCGFHIDRRIAARSVSMCNKRPLRQIQESCQMIVRIPVSFYLQDQLGEWE